MQIALKINRKSSEYSINIEQNVLGEIQKFIPEDVSKIAIISHPPLMELYGDDIADTLDNPLKITVTEGEASKSWNNAGKIHNTLLENHFDRKSLIIALGGGVIGDLAGFIAATYMRGIRFIQIPTSLLAMVDSSVGGKTAINLGGIGKNMVGAFYQPIQVLIDPVVLNTLPAIEYSNGLAEVLKYAFIRNDEGEFYNWLTEQRENILTQSSQAIIAKMIEYSVRSKANIVEQDETETNGLRALLNLGHTFAHAFEDLSGYSIPHGQAVSIGIVYATKLSLSEGLIEQTIANSILNLIKNYNLPDILPTPFPPEEIYHAMLSDKKTEGGKVKLILPKGSLSQSAIVSDISKETIINILSSS